MGGTFGGGTAAFGGLDGDEDIENEPPLLEELGVNLVHIRSKTYAVLHPSHVASREVLEDADLAGPLVFCLLLGLCQMFSGKLNFGYIYGFGLTGCAGMHMVLNLLSQQEGVDLFRVCSILGYCLLPTVPLALVSVVFSLRGVLGLVLGLGVIGWCTFAATRFFEQALEMSEQRWLIA